MPNSHLFDSWRICIPQFFRITQKQLLSFSLIQMASLILRRIALQSWLEAILSRKRQEIKTSGKSLKLWHSPNQCVSDCLIFTTQLDIILILQRKSTCSMDLRTKLKLPSYSTTTLIIFHRKAYSGVTLVEDKLCCIQSDIPDLYLSPINTTITKFITKLANGFLSYCMTDHTCWGSG